MSIVEKTFMFIWMAMALVIVILWFNLTPDERFLLYKTAIEYMRTAQDILKR